MKATIDRQFDLLAFYLAPVLLLAGTVAKSLEDGDNFKVSIIGGTLTCFAFFLFTFVVLRLTDYGRNELPRFTAVMRVLMVYTCFVGFTFGLDGALTAVSAEGLSFWTIPGAMIFPYSGLLWPAFLILLGAVYYRKQVLPARLAGLLILAGILFPIGRIPGNELFYYLGDIAFIVTFFLLARHLQSAPDTTEQPAGRLVTS